MGPFYLDWWLQERQLKTILRAVLVQVLEVLTHAPALSDHYSIAKPSWILHLDYDVGAQKPLPPSWQDALGCQFVSILSPANLSYLLKLRNKIDKLRY